jgi:hypothetical protein
MSCCPRGILPIPEHFTAYREEVLVRAIARLTAIIFILVGLVAVVGGAYMFPREVSAPAPVEPSIFGQIFEMPDFSALLFPLRLLVAGSLVLQGLTLVAAGQGLWLVANIVSKSEQSAQHLASLAARGSMTIP